jgi:hypothetical protein
MTLSYYAQHYMKMYDTEGRERPLRDTEIEFIKMLEQACETNCNMQQMVARGKVFWALIEKEDVQYGV